MSRLVTILAIASSAVALTTSVVGCVANTGPAEEEDDSWWDEAEEEEAYCGSCDEGRDRVIDEPKQDDEPPPSDPDCVPLTCADAFDLCGPLDDGCGGTIECGCARGTECTDGYCGCLADSAEPNEATAQAFDLGSFTDRPRTQQTFDGFGLDRASDVDWFQFHVDDAIGDGNPNVRVTLGDIPEGSDWELSIWYDCLGDTGGGSCRAGDPDDEIGAGCTASNDSADSATVEVQAACSGWNDSGIAVVRVRSATWLPVCLAYTLDVDVD